MGPEVAKKVLAWNFCTGAGVTGAEWREEGAKVLGLVGATPSQKQ